MRSPLQQKPLRTPGQSLDERIHSLVYDKFQMYMMVAAFMIVLAAIEWLAVKFDQPRRPWLYTVMALAVCGFSGRRVWKLWPDIRQAKLGRDGELVVGQFLEGLRAQGAKVFHDIQADGFNLDHVVICTKGVLVVETKTWSKPEGAAVISVREGVVYRNGIPAERDAVAQVSGAAHWLRRLLEESTGQKIPVHPVLLFPGWYVEPLSVSERRRLWALEVKALLPFIEHEPDRLPPDRVNMAATHLKAWITRKDSR